MHASIKDGKIILEGGLSSSLHHALPSLEGRRRFVGARRFEVAYSGHNREVLEKAGAVFETDDAMVAQPSEASPWTFKTKPYTHQLRGLEKSEQFRFFGFFMEQGTGKTKIAIDFACRLFSCGEIHGVLVFSKKGVHRQWVESELPDHCSAPFVADFWPFKRGLPDCLLERGGTLKWLAMNYDALRSEKGFEVAMSFALRHKGKLLIVADESQEIKNYKTSRHKNMSELAPLASHRLLLTGTPIAKNLEDEWAQLKWLNEDILGIKYVTNFRRRYCIMGGFENREVVGHKDVEDFKARTEPHIFRATKAEIGILPKQYNRWPFDLTAAQKEAIRNIRADLEFETSSGKIEIKNAATALMKIQQVASGFIMSGRADDEKAEVRLLMPLASNPRIQAMHEWLEARDGAPAVIWFRFRAEAEMIARWLRENNKHFVEYHGGTKDKDRPKAISMFKSGQAQIFLSNPQSGGTGLNLQGTCNDVLYYSNSFNAIDRWQSEDRVHRIGTKGIVTYTDLVAKGSGDARVLRNLRGKKSLSDLVLDGVQALLNGEDD